MDNSGTYEVYLDIKNPLIINDTTVLRSHDLDRNKLKQLLLEGNNYDSFNRWIDNTLIDETIENEEKLKNELPKMSKEEKIEKYLQEHFDKQYTGDRQVLSEMVLAYKTNTDLINSFKKIFNVDGIVVKNGRANQYIAFDSNQIKNVDNTNPTSNPDIRYSQGTSVDNELKLSNKDSQGRELSEGQKKFFANEDTKLLDKNGNLKVLYHGTPYGKFYEFNDKNMYFLTEDYQFAEDYANQKSFEQELDGEANVMEVYAKAEKVFDPSDKNDIEALRKVLPDKLQYWAREFDKETALQRIQRKDILPPKWTKEQIDKAEFGRVIGEDRYGYNNDLFIGVNDNNEVVYTTHDNYRAFERMTEKEKQDVKNKLMNGETVYFDYYGTPFGYMSYNALVDKINEYKQKGYETDAKYLQETKDAIDNHQTWKYQELSDKIEPYTDSLNETELEDIDNWSYIEELFDRESGKDVFQYIKDLGYDAINIFEKGKSNYVVFNKNQIKDVTNQNPTENPDIRYSKELEDKWTEILTKYDTGKTRTYLPGIPKVLPKANTDYQTEIADKIDSLKIPDDRKVELYGIVEQEWNDNSLKNVLRDLDAIEQDFIREQALQQEQARFEGKAYNEENRKKLILKKKAEFNKSMDYDDSVVAELDNMIPRNRNGRRTVKQWKDMAKQLGERIANLSPEQIEDIAVKSYYDLDPAHSITAYDSRTKTTDNNKRLYANDWVNKVYEGVRENRKYSMETQPIIPEQEQPVSPKQPKVLNPTEIANLTLEDANTTPVLPGKRYQKGSKESSFVSNITSDVGFLTEEQRKDITSDENVRYYAPVTNTESLKNAYEKLQEDGQRATMNWYAKDTQNASAEDVATGWILLKQYADNGDTQSMVNVAKKLRDMGSKAGQTVQAFNIMSRLTPEGMVAYTQSELQDAYEEMIKGKSKKWIDQHKADFDLTPEEVAFIMNTMQNLPAENLETNNYERKVALGQIQKIFSDKLPVERKQDQNLDENLNVIQS